MGWLKYNHENAGFVTCQNLHDSNNCMYMILPLYPALYLVTIVTDNSTNELNTY